MTVLTSLPVSELGQGGVGANEAKVDVAPMKPSECGSLQELVNVVRREDGQTLWEQEWLLTAEIPAVRLQRHSELGDTAILLTVIRGSCLDIVGYGDTDLFNAIVASLRPSP